MKSERDKKKHATGLTIDEKALVLALRCAALEPGFLVTQYNNRVNSIASNSLKDAFKKYDPENGWTK